MNLNSSSYWQKGGLQIGQIIRLLAMTLVSVITPVRPGRELEDPEDYLHQVWNSLKQQTYQDWEWLIQLDAIDTPTEQWVPAEALLDPRVKPGCVGRSYGGATAVVRNSALSRAEGDICIPLDDDDMLLPNTLEEVAESFANHPRAAMLAGHAYMLQDGQILQRERPPFPAGIIPDGMIIERWKETGATGFHYNAAAFKRSYLLHEGGWPGVVMSEDSFLFMSMAQKYPVIHLDHEIMIWRIHPGGTSQDPNTPIIRSWVKKLAALHLASQAGGGEFLEEDFLRATHQRQPTAKTSTGLTLEDLGL